VRIPHSACNMMLATEMAPCKKKRGEPRVRKKGKVKESQEIPVIVRALTANPTMIYALVRSRRDTMRIEKKQEDVPKIPLKQNVQTSIL